MLLLTRKVGETIKIGDDIEIMITKVKGGQVRIGISAPPATLVLRGELIDAARRRVLDTG